MKPKKEWLTHYMKNYLLENHGDHVIVTDKNNFFLVYEKDYGYWEIDMDENIINSLIMYHMKNYTFKPTLDGSTFEIIKYTNEQQIPLNDLIGSDNWYENVIKLFRRELRDKTNNSMVKLNELPAHSRRMTTKYLKEGLLEKEKEVILINVKNGVLHIDSETFEILQKPHDKKYLFTSRLEIDYSPIDECPTWDQFLSSVVETDIDKNLVIMYMAYTLLSHDFKWESALYIYGEGANGKGTLVKSFKQMFSHPRFTSISALEKNFGLMGLIGGNFWWANESDNKYINTEDLKRIISGEPVEIDIKHNKPETHHFKMKVMVTANEIPLLKKYADKRRFIVVRFPYKFEGKDKDVDLDTKLIQELPGLLNMLVEYIPTYLDNAAQLSANISDRYEVQYEELSDPFKIFVESFVTETGSSDNELTTLELTLAFNAWAVANNHETYNTTAIGRRIKSIFKKISPKTIYYQKIVSIGYSDSLQPEFIREKIRQRGFTGLTLDYGEIYKINPQWDYEAVNNYHLKDKSAMEIVDTRRDKISRLEFSNKIHAYSESGITWDQAINLGKTEGFTDKEVTQIVQSLIKSGKISEGVEGFLNLINKE
jgi:P4 family phage/plasmid primase-like protien